MSISIEKHMAIRDGKAVPFKRTPNVGGAFTPQFIVLHDTASGLKDDGDISWLTNPASKVSAHVVISREGLITQLAPFNVKCWHAGQSKWAGLSLLNGYAIGLEIDNPGKLVKVGEGVYKGVGSYDTNKDKSLQVAQAATAAHGSGYWLAYTDEQVEAVADLCRGLVAAYPTIRDIITHWMISPGRKIDTNPLFPLDALKARVFGGRDTPAPASTKAPEIVADATVTASSLNLRAAPIDGKVLATLPRNTRIDVQEVAADGWFRVAVAAGTHKGKTGFVSKSFVKLD